MELWAGTVPPSDLNGGKAVGSQGSMFRQNLARSQPLPRAVGVGPEPPPLASGPCQQGTLPLPSGELAGMHAVLKKGSSGASLVAQWLRICLPMQGTQVRALVWEDPTCRGATRPVSHNY